MELNEAYVHEENLIPETEEIISLISNKNFQELRARMSEAPAVDIAEAIGRLPYEYRSIVYRFLPKESASDVFSEMDNDTRESLISSFTDKELSEILSEMYIDDTVDMIEEMPASVVKRILRNSSGEDRHIINSILKYPKNSAGTIMTTEYVRLKENMTVADSLAHIKKVAIDKETIYTCYVTDDKRGLLGIVSAKDLLISEPNKLIGELMERRVISAKTTDDREEVAITLNKYGFLALPVVDAENRLVGIVTVDDAVDVIKMETEEDFSKMAAITPTEEPYLKTSALALFRARIPWLLLLMISATFSGAILGFFEASLIPALVLFVPMLMDTGGNSGSQASVTAIRGLSTGEVKLSDAMLVFWKELRVGVLCGLSLGVVGFGKVMLVDRLILGNTAVTLFVALAVSISLCATIIVAKIIGSTLPLLAKRIGFDPAVMASPFITTIVDTVSLLLYFFISANLFNLTV